MPALTTETTARERDTDIVREARTFADPVHLLRHSYGKRCAASGQDRAESTAAGGVKRKYAHMNVLPQWNYALDIGNRRKIRPKRPE